MWYLRFLKAFVSYLMGQLTKKKENLYMNYVLKWNKNVIF